MQKALRACTNLFLKTVFSRSAAVAGFFVLGFLVGPGASAATNVSGTLTSDAHWSRAGSPYIVSGLTVMQNATLTIDPGVVVKMSASNVSITILGSLLVNGTFASPVSFTSATDAATGSWNNIYFGAGATGNFSNAMFRYGGYFGNGTMQNAGGIVACSGCVFTNNVNYGIVQSLGILTVTNSSFHDEASGLSLSGGTLAVDMTDFHALTSVGVNASAGSLTITNSTFSAVTLAGDIKGAVTFTHSLNAASSGTRNGFHISQSLSTDQTWTADIPYLIDSANFSVPVGKTLSVDPGVVVKFESNNAFFYVLGTLNVNGTAGAPVYFTSMADDDAATGGDTNGNGSSSGPAAANWNVMQFLSGSVGSISHAIFRYGGYFGNGMLQLSGGTVNVSDSAFSSSARGVSVDIGTVAITGTDFSNLGVGLYVNPSGTASAHQSSFHGNQSYAIQNIGTVAVSADGNWWGAVTGPSHLANPTGTGDRVSNLVTFLPFLGYDPLTFVPTPSVSNLTQAKIAADATVTPVTNKELTSENTMRFGATVTSSGRQLKLEVELKKLFQPFDGTGTVISAAVASGQAASADFDITLDKPSTKHGPYHWRARAIDVMRPDVVSPWVEYGTTGQAAFTRAFKVAVVPADMIGDPSTNSDDIIHKTSWADARPPCVLPDISNHTYTTYATYLTDVEYCLNSYYAENTFGTVQFDIELKTDIGDWFRVGGLDGSVPKTLQYYALKTYPVTRVLLAGRNQFELAADVVAAANQAQAGISATSDDAVVVVNAGTGQTPMVLDGQVVKDAQGNAVTVGWRPALDPTSRLTVPTIVIPEAEPFETWAHEFGHLTGVLTTPEQTALPDMYLMGNTERLDVMSSGVTGVIDRRPPNMSAFSRVFLGLLREDVHRLGDYGMFPIASLYSQKFGDAVFRYQLSPTGSTANEYWTAEVRDSTSSIWDHNGIVTVPSLVLYYVNTFGDTDAQKFGWRNPERMNVNYWGYLIPSTTEELNGKQISFQSGIMDIGQTYDDFDHMVRVRAVAHAGVDGLPGIAADVEPISVINPVALFKGVIVKPDIFKESQIARHFPSPLQEICNRHSTDGLVCDTFPSLLKMQTLDSIDSDISFASRQFWILLGASVGLLLLLIFVVVRRGPRWLLAMVFLTLAVFAVFTVRQNIHIDGLIRAYNAEFMKNLHYERIHGGPLEDAEAAPLPTLDLHVFCADGRHVGMNYATGQYENQIVGAITNGKNPGAPAWIFYPGTAANDSCKYSVSAHDLQAFLAENPEIAAQVSDTTDAYSIYARVSDPVTGLQTSAVLENQPIQPGETIVHEVTGTSGVTLAVGVPDITAPVTTLSASGVAGTNSWYTGPVTITLSATDGQDGTGVQSTTYSLDGGLTWTTYAAPFVIADDGEHAVLFGSTDNAGNVEVTKNQVFHIDTTVPAATIVSPSTSAILASHSAVVSGTLVESGSGVGVVTANGAPCSLAEPTHLAFICPSVPVEEGSAVITVTATDLAGNTADASVTILVDATAPDTAIDSAPSGTVASADASIVFHSTEAGSSFVCSLDGAAPTACASPASYSVIAEGVHSFSVTATDPAGNVDPSSATATWSVDTTAPDTIIDSAQSGTVATSSASLTFHSTEAGSTLSCVLDGGAAAPCTSPASYTGLADGAHTFSVTATDAVGNTDATPATASWSVDATAPDTIIDSAPTGTVNATSASITFHSTEAGSTFVCSLDSAAPVSCTSPATYTG
ncbi:MAG: hypothetical protein RLZZ324_838, partial [Candidatus Parcubacteria bacterium]